MRVAEAMPSQPPPNARGWLGFATDTRAGRGSLTMPDTMPESGTAAPRRISRRAFVIGAAAGSVAVVGGCSRSPIAIPTTPRAAAIELVEAQRPHTGRTVRAKLTARANTVDLGGPTARTLSYGAQLPGPLVRANVGDQLDVTVINGLETPTSLHWHGLALRNDMDGAAPATPDIGSGAEFTYRFSVPHSGTYWAHPHTPLDTDRGLYIPVIVDDPGERADYDAEWIVVLDDWTDGVGASPQQIFDELRSSSQNGMGDMPGMHTMPGMSHPTDSLIGPDGGDVTYPYHLINGQTPAAATTFSAKPGQRIRLRIINAGADTAYRVALAGHTMTITHTDGFAVRPVQAEAVLVGMGERYDAIVTAGDGVFALVASAEGKDGLARAVLSTAAGRRPDPQLRPAELTGRVVTVDDLTADPSVDLGELSEPIVLPVTLTGGMARYDWGINGRHHPDVEPLTIHEGQNAILRFTNQTMMWHPMHLHGHTFQVLNSNATRGPRKDTVIVKPMSTVDVAVVADNPGTWLVHCHNTYHMDAGMMTQLDYT